MYLFSTIKNLFALTAVLFFFSVFTEASSITPPANTPPTADAGPDKTVQVNHAVTISGSSSDSDGNIVAYKWIKQSNGQVLATTESFNFTSTGTRTKTLVFTVTDDQGATASDMVVLTVTEGPVGNTPPTPTPEPTPTPAGQTIHQGQVKDSRTGNGLANVKVTVGGSSTISDENGFYILSNLTTSEEAVVNFKKDRYSLGSTKIQIKELSGDNTTSPNYLEYSMYAYSDAWANGREWSYKSQNGATGGAVEVPVGAIHKDAVGNVYNGTVSARWVFKDTMTEEGRDAFPGNFEGINSNGVLVPFVSYGLTSLELEDESGTSLNLSEHITLVLSSVTGTTANIIPLWYYDYDQGLWIEEGYAERQTDGTYRADISHPGTWSLSQPIEEEVGIYRGQIVYTDGTPAQNIRIHAIGKNWSSSDLSTDKDGVFEIEVIPDSSFQLKAYNYKDKYEANYNGTIGAISSGEIVEE